MDRSQKKVALLEFLQTIQRPDYPLDAIGDDASLTESGLIDSLAILQIISYLEQTYNLDFRNRSIDPGDLQSVNAILDLIDRETTA